jgi:hypothetical protein
MKNGVVRFILVFCFLSSVAARGSSAWDQLRTVAFLPKLIRDLPAAERRAPIVPAVGRSAVRFRR